MSVLLAALVICSGVGQPVAGTAKFYGKGTMEATARYRGLELPPGYAGCASVQECDYGGRKDANMGRTVWASVNGSAWGAYLIVDCSHPRDRARHRANDLIIEVSYATAKAQGWARNGKAPAVVWGQK